MTLCCLCTYQIALGQNVKVNKWPDVIHWLFGLYIHWFQSYSISASFSLHACIHVKKVFMLVLLLSQVKFISMGMKGMR